MKNEGVVENAGKSRFELEVEGQTAFAEYRMEGSDLVLTHTEVPASLGGMGIGSRLARGVFDLLRGGASRLPHAANAELPIWADDGRLAYAATDHGWKDVFVTRIDADAPAQLLYRSEEDKIPTEREH